MDARTIRLRLSGHGDVTAHRDGSFTLSLRRPVGEYWRERLRREVALQVPGAQIRLDRCRPSSDPAWEVHEVVFGFRDAPQGACTEGARYPQPLAATSAESAGGEGKSAPSFREDVTAGRDRPFRPLAPTGAATVARGGDAFRAITVNRRMEGNADEVGIGDGAVVPPARFVNSPGMLPGSPIGPGGLSPGAVVESGSGRAA